MNSNTHTHAQTLSIENIHQTHAHSRFTIMVIETCPNAQVHKRTHTRAQPKVYTTQLAPIHMRRTWDI